MTTDTKTKSDPKIAAAAREFFASDEAIKLAVKGLIARHFNPNAPSHLSYADFLREARLIAELAKEGVIHRNTANQMLHLLVSRVIERELEATSERLFDHVPVMKSQRYVRQNDFNLRFSRR